MVSSENPKNSSDEIGRESNTAESFGFDSYSTPQTVNERRPQKDVDASQPPNPRKPPVQKSWEEIMKKVNTLDEDLVKGYKEDIDTLLVFAGLFSAVVTAFTVESYQWLEEDPINKNVVLLTQIAQQLSGMTPPQAPSPTPLFTPSSSVIRINTYWFLSLTLALVDALFGLLCKQWVREHQRQTNTQTPGQALALRWLRYQSFERWHVPKILASLPILLEVALFLFFAGLLELLWARHHIPFTIVLVFIGLAVLFYLATTILPGLSVTRQALQIHPDFVRDRALFSPNVIPYLPALDLICPYKSPQSWLMFRLLSTTFHLPGCKKLLYSFLAKYQQSYWDKEIDSIDSLNRIISKNILHLSNWPSLDLNVIQRFSRIEGCPDLYELKGFRWLVQETRDIPSMIPHLKAVIEELPPDLTIPAVFGQWKSPFGKPAWSATDIETALEPFYSNSDLNDYLFSDRSSTRHLALGSQVLCFRHLLATYDEYWAPFDRTGDWLVRVAEEIWRRILEEPRNSRFMPAFFSFEVLLMGPSRMWCGTVLDFYGQHLEELDVQTQVKMIERLYPSILLFLESSSEHDVKSTLLATKHTVDFFTLLNEKICKPNGLLSDKHWRLLLGRIGHTGYPLDFETFTGETFGLSSFSIRQPQNGLGGFEMTLLEAGNDPSTTRTIQGTEREASNPATEKPDKGDGYGIVAPNNV